MTKKYVLVADDVVDNLTSSDGSVPLSAKQGKVLNDTKIAIAQGSAQAGKLLGVGNDGNVTAVDPPASGLQIIYGTTLPTSTIGNDGDMYVYCTEE